MTGLDTSVVLRLLVGEPLDQFESARRFLDQLFEEGEQATVSDLVASETYFALQYHYKVPKKTALATLRSLFESGEIVSTGAVADVLQTKGLASATPGFVDRLIHRSYIEGGGKMATFEKKARRLERVNVL